MGVYVVSPVSIALCTVLMDHSRVHPVLDLDHIRERSESFDNGAKVGWGQGWGQG